MSLEAARTRMRMHQAYLAKMLPEAGAATLMGYSLCPIRSPVFQAVSNHDPGSAQGKVQAPVITPASSNACPEFTQDRVSL